MYAVHGQSHGQFSSGSLLAILLLQPFESPFSSHLSNKAGALGLDVLILARQVHRVTVSDLLSSLLKMPKASKINKKL